MAALTLGSAAVVVLVVGRGAASAMAALRGPEPVAVATQVAAVSTPAAAGQATREQGAQTPPAAVPPTAAPSGTQVTPQGTSQPTAQAAAQPTAQGTQQGASQVAPTAAAQRREHTIAAGDSLSAIAQRYGTTVDALVAANRLANRNVTLQVGQRLVIPG